MFRENTNNMVLCCKKKKESAKNSSEEVKEEVDRERVNKNMRMMSAFIREIQVPVSDLCGLKSIIEDIPENSPIFHYARCMNTCGLLLCDMIENMKLYYTLSSGLYETQKSLFALRTELEVVLESLVIEHEKKYVEQSHVRYGDVDLTLNIGESVPQGLVEGDSSCILKIFKCLLENAMRFTLEGTVTANVFLDSKDETRRTAMLHMEVVDSGVGVPEDTREVIFEPLTKSHTESIHGGVGMGLPVASAMCKFLGGSLSLEPNPNLRGSTFHACFPIAASTPGVVSFSKTKVLRDGHDDRRRASSRAIMSEMGITTSETPKKILLVEDIQLNRKIVTRMMRDLDVEISTAVDGMEAVAACHREQFNLILMDISMPKMGGIEACVEIKKNCPNNKLTPIIALTGTLAGGMENACLKAGMVQCITKPIRKRQLLQSIIERCYTQKSTSSSEPPI